MLEIFLKAALQSKNGSAYPFPFRNTAGSEKKFVTLKIMSKINDNALLLSPKAEYYQICDICRRTDA